MPELEELKGQIEAQKKKKSEQRSESAEKRETIDREQVDKIVDRMQKKYRTEGIDTPEIEGRLGKLIGIVANKDRAEVNIESVEDLQEFKSPLVKNLGKFYLAFKSIFDPLANSLNKMPIASDVRYYLYSANMHYSVKQWLALSIAASAIVTAFIFIILAITTLLFEIIFIFPFIIAFIAGTITFGIMLYIPKSKANARGEALSAELPFALRQMATEMKAGIGLYKTMQTISTSDYGILSEEFGRTIMEIEEGSDTKEALKHFALRSQSKSLRSALFHVIRALKTGGNLSEIMNDIAQDVSFELRLKITDFAEKMNFFGVIYIFIAIVAPVFVGILGTVTNAPVTAFSSFSLPPMMIAITYLLGFPLILGAMTFYMKIIEPKV